MPKTAPKTAARRHARSTRSANAQLPKDLRQALEQLHRHQQQQTVTKPSTKKTSRSRQWVPDTVTTDTTSTGPTRTRRPRGKHQTTGDTDSTAVVGLPFWEQQRRLMIRDRNRRRRWPWIPAAGTVAVGLLGKGATVLYGTQHIPAEVTAGIVAGIPTVMAVIVGMTIEHRHQVYGKRGTEPLAPTHRTWLREIALAGVTSSAIVYWIALAGLSWWVVLVILVGTLAIGARWWRANPVGPGVPRLEPTQSEPEPEPESAAPQATVEAPKPHDDFAALWDRYNARGKGKALNSRLTNRRETEFAVIFDAELARGAQTPATLRACQGELASGLGINSSQLIVEDDPQERGEHFAQVTIVTKNPVATIRYYSGPRVTATETDGIVHGAGRFGDGRGEVDIVMWNEAGFVPTAIIGATRSGKSSVGNICTDGALETGLLNLIYIDPKGVSSAELTAIARIAILGPENAARAPELINAILAARRAFGIQHRVSKFNPTPEMPGWMVLHDEFSELVNRGYRAQALAWTSLVNTIAAMGMWAVGMNQAMTESKWGDDQCRQAFATQLIVMRMRTNSDKLIPGLELSPSSLPNRKGVGVYAYDQASRSNVPVQYDYLPEPKDGKQHPDAPLTTATAFGRSGRKQPNMMPEDYAAIVSVLGPPVNGRWVVGPGGTHQFPDIDGKPAPAVAAVTAGTGTKPRTSGGWGARLAQAATATGNEDLNVSQRRVFEVIAAGITKTGEIETALAATMSRATVHRALDKLIAANRIHRPANGEYAIGPESA